ncbi:hypothetical protein [Litoribrevibacter albus]|uniref:Uncharacterized protein n=1 Tax=Litoribrevibacter albus TaxID=1473156 RepID=A0AA37S836_9GAMM|nr:hypothetical protein [Litoribrevibacter albus]GLQ30885.1 hypothetical protein GCM10007876_13640 [Litoribrevibacter albus]
MDIIINQHIQKQVQQLKRLSDRAIGQDFKKQVDNAIDITLASGAVYNRLQRTYSANVTKQDQKRVAAGRITTESVTFSQRSSGGSSLRKLEQAMKTGAGLPSNVTRTVNEVAVASNQPQAINLLSLLHPMLRNDVTKNDSGVQRAATALGLAATTAGFVATSGVAGATVNWLGRIATYSGFTMSLIKPDAPDKAFHQLSNYIACLSAWCQKSCQLIDNADPEGQWSFRDVHIG